MELDLHPAGGVFDGGPRVVGAPPLDETQLEDAELPELVDADSDRGWKTLREE